MNDYIKQPPYAAGTGGENVLDSSSLFFDNLTRWQINDNLYYLTSKDLSYLFVSGFGVFLSKKSERLVIKHNDKYVYEIPFFRLKNIVILSKSVGISSDLVEQCCKYSISVSFHDFSAKPIALLQSVYSPAHGMLKYAQLEAKKTFKGTEIAASIVRGKIANQIALLKYAVKNIKHSAIDADKEDFVAKKCLAMNACSKECIKIDKSKTPQDNINAIMGYEGTAARLYWQAFGKLVEDKAVFEIRTRGKIPGDTVNSLLNYGYGILYSKIWCAAALAGLDPYISFLHSDETGKPALIFDLIEEFRSSVVDKTVLAFVRLERRVSLKDGLLSDETRHAFNKKLLERLTARENYLGQKIMLGDIILAQAKRLVSVLENREQKYKPFRLKW